MKFFVRVVRKKRRMDDELIDIAINIYISDLHVVKKNVFIATNFFFYIASLHISSL